MTDVPDSASLQPTVGTQLQQAVPRLVVSSSTPRLDAEVLLAHTLNVSRAQLIARLSDPLGAPQAALFQAMLERRADGESIAYLVGEREFYGLRFMVNPHVLVPRPETELLVERMLIFAADRRSRGQLRIADIGTGSGAIAVSLAVKLPQAQIIATDISADALAVAAANARAHGVAERITFRQGDLLAALDAPVHLIASNPPYTILDEVDADVLRYEPHLALDGGPDGLDPYRRLLADAPTWLLAEGRIGLEIDPRRAAQVYAIALAAFPKAVVSILPDAAGHARVMTVRLPGALEEH